MGPWNKSSFGFVVERMSSHCVSHLLVLRYYSTLSVSVQGSVIFATIQGQLARNSNLLPIHSTVLVHYACTDFRTEIYLMLKKVSGNEHAVLMMMVMRGMKGACSFLVA